MAIARMGDWSDFCQWAAVRLAAKVQWFFRPFVYLYMSSRHHRLYERGYRPIHHLTVALQHDKIIYGKSRLAIQRTFDNNAGTLLRAPIHRGGELVIDNRARGTQEARITAKCKLVFTFKSKTISFQFVQESW